MPRHVVVLGGGVTGEAFVAALRRLDKEIAITLVEHELVGGECSYWACIPSKTLLRPVEIAFRARSAHGVKADHRARAGVLVARPDRGKGRLEPGRVGRRASTPRSSGEGASPRSPGRIEVGERELPYDELMVATGSLPQMPPIDGLDAVEPWTSREATSASEVPESLVVVGGGAVGCELAQFYSRLGAR